MALFIDIRPYKLEEIPSDIHSRIPDVTRLAVETGVVDSPNKLYVRELKPKDIYDQFSGKTDVTLALANNYEWKWTWSGLTSVPSEISLVDVPSNVLRDWTRVARIWFIEIYEPIDGVIQEIRFYKQNNIALSIDTSLFDTYETSMLTFKPEITYSRKDVGLKITAVVKTADGSVRFRFGGLTALPVGEAGEPNPKVITTARL